MQFRGRFDVRFINIVPFIICILFFIFNIFAGKEGVVTESLRKLILEDMKSGPSTVRTIVPY